MTYDVDVTPGYSGAMVLITAPEIVHGIQAKFSNIGKLAIGVHVGTDTQNNVNYGTFVTKDTDQWIKKEVLSFLKLIQQL